MSAAARRLMLESDHSVPSSAPEGELQISADLPFEIRTRKRFTTKRIVGFVVFAAVATLAAQKGLQAYRVDTPVFPASIGGFNVLADPDSLQLQKAYDRKASAAAGETETRFYGDVLGGTQAQLIWVRRPGASPQSVLSEGFGYRESQMTPTKIADTTFYCTEAPPSGSFHQSWIPAGGSGGACAWTSGNYEWMLVSQSSEGTPVDLANGTAVGRGASAFILIGLWAALAIIFAFLALRTVWAMLLR
jgi:hypothetical protein